MTPRKLKRTIARDERKIADHHDAADTERNHQPPAGTRRTQRGYRPEAKDQHGRESDMRQDAAEQHCGGQGHVAGTAHRVAQQVE